MSLIDRLQNDIKAISSNGNEFGAPVTFVSKLHSTTVTVNALCNKIHTSVDEQGNVVHSKNATVAVSEYVLNDAGYVTRNAFGEVAMIKDRVSVADSTGIVRDYVVKSQKPDETVGLIVLILSDYKV